MRLAAVPADFPILFGALFTMATAYAAGRLVLRALRVKFSAEERHVFAFLLGSAALSMLVFAFCVAQIAYPATFVVTGVLLIGGAAFTKLPPAVRLAPVPARMRYFTLALGLPFAVLYLVNALAPEHSPDGSQYHLGLVSQYLRDHGFSRHNNSFYANLPEGLEMLFLFAFAFGRHSAAALVEFGFLLLLPFGALAFGRRFQVPAAACFASLVLFTSPVFGISGVTAYNDAAAACALFFLFYLCEMVRDERQRGLYFALGIVAGFCFGIKYTLFPAVPFALVYVALPGWRLFSSGAALTAMPWLAKNWIQAGNPVSPFFNRIFPNRYVTPGFEDYYRQIMSNPASIHGFDRFMDNVVRGGISGGYLGPLFLLFPLALLALRKPLGRRVVLAAVVFGLPALTNYQTRFLMPAAVFVALGMGVALSRLPAALMVLMAAHAVASWPAVAQLYHAGYVYTVRGFPLREALRQHQSEDASLVRELPGYEAAKMIDRVVPVGGRVFALTSPPRAYLRTPVVVGYESAKGNRLQDTLDVAHYSQYQPSVSLRFAFPLQAVRKFRVLQTAAHPSDQWNVSEVRMFAGAVEVKRAPEWRLRARPSEWNVGLAFDNNPVTRWRTDEYIRGGEWVEVDLGQPRQMDSVKLEAAPDQGAVRLQLEIQQVSGSWKRMGAPDAAAVPSPWNLARAATATIREGGYTHLILIATDAIFQDIYQHQDTWGVTLVGELPEWRLYKLER